MVGEGLRLVVRVWVGLCLTELGWVGSGLIELKKEKLDRVWSVSWVKMSWDGLYWVRACWVGWKGFGGLRFG